MEGVLYRIRIDGKYICAIGQDQGEELIRERYDRICEGYFSIQLITKTLLDAGYYWPTLFKYYFRYCKSYNFFQSYGNRKITSTPLCLILPLRPFDKWGIDIVEPLPHIPRKNRYIVVGTYYMTKCIEERPLKEASMEEVVIFLCEYTMKRF